jgi:hypothetical protein
MNTKCNECGSLIKSEIRTFVCDMTGMKHEVNFGSCKCNYVNQDLKLNDKNKLQYLDKKINLGQFN